VGDSRLSRPRKSRKPHGHAVEVVGTPQLFTTHLWLVPDGFIGRICHVRGESSIPAPAV